MINIITNFIWYTADDVLRDVSVSGKYRNVILPMNVFRCLDALFEPTKEVVLNMKKQLDSALIANPNAALCQTSRKAFFSSSPFTLKYLKYRAKVQQLKADFEAYLDDFSHNVQGILDKFKFRNQIPMLVKAYGHVKQPGLDNYSTRTVFQKLICRFNEENNKETGEHLIPCEVVKLIADLILLPIADQIESETYLVYDGVDWIAKCTSGSETLVSFPQVLRIV